MLLGYPGSASSLLQQLGRAGRKGRDSLSVLVLRASPLEQFIARHSGHLLRRPAEAAVVCPRNATVLRAHALCAAAEIPLRLVGDGADVDAALFGSAELLHAVIFEDVGKQRLNSAHVFGQNTAEFVGAVSSNPCRGGFFPRAGGEEREQLTVYKHNPAAFPPSGSPAAAHPIRNIGQAYSVRWRSAFSKPRSEDWKLQSWPEIDSVADDKAFFSLYVGALYKNQGKQYVVTDLDIEQRVAGLELITKPRSYATSPLVTNTVDIVKDFHCSSRAPSPTAGWGGTTAAAAAKTKAIAAAKAEAPTTTWHIDGHWQGVGLVHCGEVLCTTLVTGYSKCDPHTMIPIAGEQHTIVPALPPIEFVTTAAWLAVPASLVQQCEAKGAGQYVEGAHAANHALKVAWCLVLDCEQGDIRTEHAGTERRLLVYDAEPGASLSKQAAARMGEVVAAALALLEDCGCDRAEGCPSCTLSSERGCYNAFLSKASAVLILKSLLHGAGGEGGAAAAAAGKSEGE